MIKFVLSFFGIGFIKKMPGTFASFATIPIIYLLDSIYLLILMIILLPLSIILINKLDPNDIKKDPSWIVIDELLGMCTSALFLLDKNAMSLIIIFLLFRFFDILKPFPINLIDKKMHNALGIILDDLVSGIFAGLIYLLLALIFL